MTAQNAEGQKLTGYRGTVNLISDSTVTLPPDYTFTAAGTHTFMVVFHSGNTHTVYVSDVSNGGSGYSETFVQCPGMTLTATNNGPMCPTSGSAVTLTAITNAQSPTFQWHLAHFPDQGDHSGDNVAVTFAALWEVYMNDSATGCFMSALTNIDLQPAPAIMNPNPASGDFTASIAGDTNGPYSDIVWSVDSDATIVSGQGTATVTIRPDPAATSLTFDVTATATRTNCWQTNSHYVSLIPAPPSAAITTGGSVCPHANGTASVPDAGAGARYFWAVQNGSLVSGQGTPSIVFSAPASGTVQLFATVSHNGLSTNANTSVPVTAATATLFATVSGPAARRRSTSPSPARRRSR